MSFLFCIINCILQLFVLPFIFSRFFCASSQGYSPPSFSSTLRLLTVSYHLDVVLPGSPLTYLSLALPSPPASITLRFSTPLPLLQVLSPLPLLTLSYLSLNTTTIFGLSAATAHAPVLELSTPPPLKVSRTLPPHQHHFFYNPRFASLSPFPAPPFLRSLHHPCPSNAPLLFPALPRPLVSLTSNDIASLPIFVRALYLFYHDSFPLVSEAVFFCFVYVFFSPPLGSHCFIYGREAEQTALDK